MWRGILMSFLGAAVLALPQNGWGQAPIPQRYAVLVSTVQASDTSTLTANNSEFWSDLVMTYRTLRQYGFDRDHIFVLYGDGNDLCSASVPPSNLPGDFSSLYCNEQKEITDVPLTVGGAPELVKDNICHVLCCLATGAPATVALDNESEKHCACPGTDPGDAPFSCKTEDWDIPKLSAEDFLFVWVKGHATATASGTSLEVGEEYLDDSEAQVLLEKLEATRRVFAMETCFSSGWLDQLKALDGPGGNTRTVAMSASGGGSVGPGESDCSGGVWGEMSYPMWYPESVATLTGTPSSFDVPHGRFSLWLAAALAQRKSDGTPLASDKDDNNLVSIKEAFGATRGEIEDENSQVVAKTIDGVTTCELSDLVGSPGPVSCQQTPTICDPHGIAPCVFMRLLQGGLHEKIFAMDHQHDFGGVPSNTEIWYHGPDLWTRQAEDGLSAPEPVLFGQDNHVYVRAHNIGCTSLGAVHVDVWWSEPTAWASPSEWEHLNGETDPSLSSATISNLQAEASEAAHLTWAKENIPEPGSYCLHAVVDTVGDAPNPDDRAYWDNNKVQVNLSVVASASEVSTDTWFWIANWSKEPSIDLSADLRGLSRVASARLELPPGVRLTAVSGARLVRGSDGWTALELPRWFKDEETGGRATARVLLKPGERRRVVLHVQADAQAAGPPVGSLRIEERVRNEVMGGVDFAFQPTNPVDLQCSLERTLQRALDRLAGKSIAANEGSVTECGAKHGLFDKLQRTADLQRTLARSLSVNSPEFLGRYRRAAEKVGNVSLRDTLPKMLGMAREQLFYLSVALSDMHQLQSAAGQ